MHRIAAIAAAVVMSLVAGALLPAAPVVAASARATRASVAPAPVSAEPARPHRASVAVPAGAMGASLAHAAPSRIPHRCPTTEADPDSDTYPDATSTTGPDAISTSPDASSATISTAGAADRIYDPGRLAPLATGSGIRVAIIDSGVDASQPRLRGRVLPGRDLLHGNADGRQDCVGHGTAVAGIIAAAPGPGMRGLAPGVRIVPVRVSEQEQIGDHVEGAQGGPGAFARAIEWAADPRGGHAQVVNLSVVTTVDDPRVRKAVADAIAAGVVLVAAVGNNATPTAYRNQSTTDRATSPAREHGDPPSYPAAYPGVIGVGAAGTDGMRAPYSQRGNYVDLVAVGEDVTVPVPGGGLAVVRGTSFAAPFVSATAALVLRRFPGSTPDQVRRRLVATADPAPGDRADYGYGLLNPYRALTETLSPDRPAASPSAPTKAPAVERAAQAERIRRADARQSALALAGAGGAVVILAGLLAVVVGRGRRRGWRPPGPPRT